MAKRAATRTTAATNVVATIPMEDERIESQIDMKLSKQDLIDMVIEENREALEDKRDVLQAASKEAGQKVQEEINASKNNLMNYLKASKKTFLKKFEALGELNIDPRNVNINRALDSEGIVPINDEGQHARKIVGLQYNVPAGFVFYVNPPPKPYNSKVRYIVPTDTFGVNGQLYATDDELNKVYASLTQSLKVAAAANAALAEINGQLGNVDKMGKRAKAQLIKTILGNSSGGKAVLDNMTSIKANITQALLGPSKK